MKKVAKILIISGLSFALIMSLLGTFLFIQQIISGDYGFHTDSSSLFLAPVFSIVIFLVLIRSIGFLFKNNENN